MNCIIIDDDKLSRRIIEEFIQRTENLELLNSFENAMDAINVFRNDPDVDLIFLDIEMPEMSGLDFMDTLKNPPQIIIVSSKDKYALNAFEYDVTDYLLKPISYGRFFKAVSKAQTRFTKSKVGTEGDEIFIKKNSALVRLKYDDILWVEALENYVIFNTFSEKFTIHFTLKSVEHQLPTGMFIRVHRSFIVNKSMIQTIKENSLELIIGSKHKNIPIGNSYREPLLNAINVMAR